ncbi:hypothetical protein CPter91_0074 [Collimonas pratensis]|uniref:Uncharacterized protein n=1 Tax=Collimonas pratensis TaxID=279113 RepID=A0A127PXD5_9BURK|nr:hypothetical protein CPter91_0074 [Collimonas pratensis]
MKKIQWRLRLSGHFQACFAWECLTGSGRSYVSSNKTTY